MAHLPDRPLAGRGEPTASDQARATTGMKADRRLLPLGMMVCDLSVSAMVQGCTSTPFDHHEMVPLSSGVK
jgi:hypothetical protein